MKKFRNIILITFAIVLCFSSFGCGKLKGKNFVKEIEKVFNIDLLKGEIIYFYEDHSSFNGDGESFLKVKIKDDNFEEKLKSNQKFNNLPLSDSVNKLAGEIIIGLKYPDKDEQFFIEQPNCYYSFFNKQGDIDLSKPVYSYNFYYIEYDNQSKILSCFEFDT